MENNPNAPENLRVKLSKFKSPLTFNEWAKQFKVGYHYVPPQKFFEGNPSCGIKPTMDFEESGFRYFIRNLFRF